MSEENVEIVRRGYEAMNTAWSAPNPRQSLHAWAQRFLDPEVDWELDPEIVIEQRVYHGIDGAMKFFEFLIEDTNGCITRWSASSTAGTAGFWSSSGQNRKGALPGSNQ